MIILDTNHLSVLANPESEVAKQLADRLAQEDDTVVPTIVCAEESLRGWLALIHGKRDVQEQMRPYQQLSSLIDFLADWEVILLNQAAVDEFKRLRKQRIRVGPQDLKIASIALAHDALLLSANLKDFEKVPGLRIENWLEP